MDKKDVIDTFTKYKRVLEEVLHKKEEPLAVSPILSFECESATKRNKKVIVASATWIQNIPTMIPACVDTVVLYRVSSAHTKTEDKQVAHQKKAQQKSSPPPPSPKKQEQFPPLIEVSLLQLVKVLGPKRISSRFAHFTADDIELGYYVVPAKATPDELQSLCSGCYVPVRQLKRY